MHGSRVSLPPDAGRRFQVFVNGVPKQEGVDFEVRGSYLVFADELVPPRRMTLGTYARLMFWGRYKTEHSVDLVYRRGDGQAVANGLEILPPEGSPSASQATL
ncbi:MAG: hypothetical protein QOH74_404 [Gaiellales bacterium]|jgi:hypothetical protein|nr:hypothetical protein [Gaiellales bacterium]